jgi:P27 family predicted phage terminase small subunit
MGNKNSGPRPRPTVIKILRGTTRKDRLNPAEPKLERATEAFDVPPLELEGDPVAIAEWSRVVPMLRRIGLVSEAERSTLIALCQQWSRYLEAQKEIREHGAIDPGGDHGPVMNPNVAVADKSLGHCLKLWAELGLTPSGRSKMAALPQTEPENQWAGML